MQKEAGENGPKADSSMLLIAAHHPRPVLAEDPAGCQRAAPRTRTGGLEPQRCAIKEDDS